MMKKILFYRNIEEIEYGIYQTIDYHTIDETIQSERKGNCPNFGNKVWLQGLISELTADGVSYEFWNPEMLYEEINERFDCMIKPCANIFSIDYAYRLEELAEIFSHIHIPIFIISCGIQINEYKDMDRVISVIKEPATKFIKSVYNKGGEFALRGHITKEFFDRLGFSSAEVTGCPSLYQNGRNLSITKREVSFEQFKAVVNGQNYHMSTPFYMNIFKKHPNSIFMDQDHYYNYMYNPEFLPAEFTMKQMLKYVKDEGVLGLDLVSSNRLHLFADIPNWMMYLMKDSFALSFGARIHGNIMSLLSGVPALLHPCDCRTEEMADFYEIPTISDAELKNTKDVYELYEKLDYSTFNKNFGSKYDFYNNFFVKHGIIDTHLNEKNTFLDLPSNHNGEIPYKVNESKLEMLQKALKKNRNLYELENKLFRIYRGIK